MLSEWVILLLVSRTEWKADVCYNIDFCNSLNLPRPQHHHHHHQEDSAPAPTRSILSTLGARISSRQTLGLEAVAGPGSSKVCHLLPARYRHPSSSQQDG